MLNIQLSYDLAILHLGVYSRSEKTDTHKNVYTNVHNSIIQKTQKVETQRFTC